MLTVIKNKGKIVKAYQLGSGNPVIDALIADGKIEDLEDGCFAIRSLETVSGSFPGEIARVGDWIKIDGNGWPYPNDRAFFEANHRLIEGDTFEQIPRPLPAWDASCGMCPEILFLTGHKGLVIDEASDQQRYTATLWGTKESAAADAVIVFYSISYDEKGGITDADFNFVQREEFDRTYTILSEGAEGPGDEE